MGETLIHGEGLVGAREEFTHRCSDKVGHILATIGLGQINTRPAAVFHLLERGFEPGGGCHDTIFKAAALEIPNHV